MAIKKEVFVIKFLPQKPVWSSSFRARTMRTMYTM